MFLDITRDEVTLSLSNTFHLFKWGSRIYDYMWGNGPFPFHGFFFKCLYVLSEWIQWIFSEENINHVMFYFYYWRNLDVVKIQSAKIIGKVRLLRYPVDKQVKGCWNRHWTEHINQSMTANYLPVVDSVESVILVILYIGTLTMRPQH